jgi:hypothetical protein
MVINALVPKHNVIGNIANALTPGIIALIVIVKIAIINRLLIVIQISIPIILLKIKKKK